MQKLFALFLVLVGTFALTACNTVEGVGEDVQAGGEALQDVAD